MTTGTNTNQQGAGCLTLFALPFCGVGLWLAYDVVGRFAWGVEDWQQFTLILIAALVFGGGGFGLLIWSRIAAGKLAEEARLKAAHPDQPWMWKTGWASGRIEGSSRATMTLAWVMAFFTTVLSAPTVISIPEEVIDKGNHPTLLGLVFPLAAIGFVIWGLRATARWRKFSVSVFQMSAVPGVVGGRLRGTIQSGLQSPPEEGVGLSLTCVHQRRDSESNRSMHESILWQDQRTVGREHLYAGLPGLTFPVDFYVPFECRETDEPDSGSKVVWRLEATAKVAGIDYRTQFEVPVFKTPASSPEPPEEGAFTFRSEVKKEFDPKTATIAVRLSAGGGTEYFFPAARNVGAALSVTTFLLIFAGAIWFQLHLEIFLLFPILTGLFTLLMLVFTVDLWFTSNRVVVESGEVRVHRLTLGFRTTTVIPCVEVSDVKLHIGMQQNQTTTQSGQAYYDIEMHRKHGRKVTAGRGIRNKREAEWLAEQMLLQIAESRR